MTRCRLIAAAATALALAAALPSVASATDYCVGAPGCAQADSFVTLEQALAKAEAQTDADRVLIGPGEYKAQAITGFSYGRLDGPVEIIGAGRGQTVLTGRSDGTGNVMFLNGGQGTSIHDLTIRIPTSIAAKEYRGLTLKDTARRIEVVQEPGQSDHLRGVFLGDGATLSDSTVTLHDSGSAGVYMQKSGPHPPNVISGSTIAAEQAVYVDGDGRIERSSVTGLSPAVYAKNGLTEVVGSLLRVPDGGTNVWVTCETVDTSVRLEGDTLVGIGSTDTTAVTATTSHGPDHDIDVSIRDSILGGDLPVLTAANGLGGVRITSAFSAYDPGKNQLSGKTTADQTDIVRSDPGFVDAPGGTFRLRPDSPLVDAGAPDADQGIELDGNPLVVDGNGDGSARRDIGAYELAAPARQPQADTQAPVITGFRARRSRVAFRLSERARVTVKIQRRLAGGRARYRTIGRVSARAAGGANRTRLSARIRRSDARPGRYRAVIVAVDAAGNRSAPQAATFRVSR